MTSADARLLVVEDSASMRALIHRLLAEFGIAAVDEAEDGVVALTRLHASRYNLVISDWYMPRMTGIELLRAIRADPALRSLPVLLVMGYISKNLVLEAAAAGATGFLTKPFVDATLAEKLSALLGCQPRQHAGPMDFARLHQPAPAH